ncbi:FAD NAD(P)-binding domain-containing [Lecanosticta acicola]|uniref:FAD NAD(P)-binding domain-containing n=1 Tax=Lecanosticta acicola TaxID=111012 RepID=A0AAI8Z3X6_9PEZI|nr:FAD NAD(P)-binding domain-containing [Lecanosticta acicola]
MPSNDPGPANGMSSNATTGPQSTMPSLMNGVNGISQSYCYPEPIAPGPYKVLDQYHSKPNRLRVACVGAGASGLCLAYKMEKMLEPGSFELTLFEKNPHYGGTWYENIYPGVACDIPSHNYTFTWDPKPDWSYFFAYGPEIQGYFESFAKRHGSERYMKLNSKVIEGKWDVNAGIWMLTVEDQRTKKTWNDWAHCLVNGTGILNNWKWPDIEGLHEFGGPKMHSAAWDHDVELKDKKIGVIGTGSTSVQIVPQLQKIAKELQVYMRSSTWISPPFGAGALTSVHRGRNVDPGQRQYEFTEEDKRRFRENPDFHLEFRKSIEAEINGLFGMYKQNSELSNTFRKVITEEMNRRMGPGHEHLKSFIIPKWSPGCRRISPGDGYLEALVQSNVSPITTPISKITSTGILTSDGQQHDFDVLVCATGFKVAFQPAFNLVNGSGTSLVDDWSAYGGPNLYMGVSAPRFPNYFTIVGPGATWSSGTLLPSIETTIEYSVKLMRKIQKEHIKSLQVSQAALDDLYAHFDEFHKDTVWQEECRSWFKDGKKEGRIYLWPGSTIHFLKTIKEPRLEDYEVEWRHRNRFAFLGNGEVKATASRDVQGLSTYMRSSDHEWNVE